MRSLDRQTRLGHGASRDRGTDRRAERETGEQRKRQRQLGDR